MGEGSLATRLSSSLQVPWASSLPTPVSFQEWSSRSLWTVPWALTRATRRTSSPAWQRSPSTCPPARWCPTCPSCPARWCQMEASTCPACRQIWSHTISRTSVLQVWIQSNLPCQSYLARLHPLWRAKLILDVTLAFFLQHRNSKFLQLYNKTGMHFAGSICESGGGAGGGGELSDQMNWWPNTDNMRRVLLQLGGGRGGVPNYKVAKY